MMIKLSKMSKSIPAAKGGVGLVPNRSAPTVR